MKDRLEGLLQDLHDELASGAGELDSASREQLRGIATDIERALGQSGSPEAEPGQLQEAVVSFETEHPRLAGILEGIADTLVKLGI